jgi:condensation domain-containing protein
LSFPHHAQQWVWFLEQSESSSSVHNIPTCIRLAGPLNVAVLEQSFNEIVRRHESLIKIRGFRIEVGRLRSRWANTLPCV